MCFLSYPKVTPTTYRKQKGTRWTHCQGEITWSGEAKTSKSNILALGVEDRTRHPRQEEEDNTKEEKTRNDTIRYDSTAQHNTAQDNTHQVIFVLYQCNQGTNEVVNGDDAKSWWDRCILISRSKNIALGFRVKRHGHGKKKDKDMETWSWPRQQQRQEIGNVKRQRQNQRQEVKNRD